MKQQPTSTAAQLPPNGASSSTSSSRRGELLQSARKYRNKFVLSASSGGSGIATKITVSSGTSNANSNSGSSINNKGGKKEKGKERGKDTPPIAKIPAFDAIDNALVYLTDIIDDGLSVDAESIMADNIDFYEQYNTPEGAGHSADSTQADDNKDPFAVFLDKLRKPAAFDLVKSIQTLVLRFEAQLRTSKGNNFSSNSMNMVQSPQVLSSSDKDDANLPITNGSIHNDSSTDSQWAVEIWKFLDKAFLQMKDNSLWGTETPDQFVKSCEHLEKFIFIKLHPFIFLDMSVDEKQANIDSRARIQSLSFLSPEHLDLRVHKLTKLLVKSFIATSPYVSFGLAFDTPASTTSSSLASSANTNLLFKEVLQEPIALIRCLDHCESIIDMIYYLKLASLSLARILYILKHGSIESDSSPSSSSAAPLSLSPTSLSLSAPSGADEFLPMMILVVQGADLSKIQSIMKYLQTYSSPKKLVSETGYLLTQFISAVHFLETVDSSALTISPDEFDRAIDLCKQLSLRSEPIIIDTRETTSNSNGILYGCSNNSNSKTREENAWDGDAVVKVIESTKMHLKTLEKKLKQNSVVLLKSTNVNNTITSTPSDDLLRIYDNGLLKHTSSISMGSGRSKSSESSIGCNSFDPAHVAKYSELMRVAEQRYEMLQRDHHLMRPAAILSAKKFSSSANFSSNPISTLDGEDSISNVGAIRYSIQAVSDARLGDLSRSDIQLLIEDYQRLAKVCSVLIHDKHN